MRFLVLYIFILLASWLGVRTFIKYVRVGALLDTPNERSSHKRPTPRGAGLVIVLLTLSFATIYSVVAPGFFPTGVIFGGLLVSAVSFADDLASLEPGIRLVFHTIAAISAVVGAGPYESLEIPGIGVFDIGTWGYLVTVLLVIFFINAINFMDGIDGMAGLQGTVSGVGLACLGAVSGSVPLIGIGCALSAASLGFLVHNWSPAKVFMGDVGAAFIGYCIGVLPLMAMEADPALAPRLFWISMALAWLVAFDVLVTLARRIKKRERVWRPHRTHIYQRLVDFGLSHGNVSLVYGLGSVLLLSSIIIGHSSSSLFFTALTLVMFIEAFLLLCLLEVVRRRATDNTPDAEK